MSVHILRSFAPIVSPDGALLSAQRIYVGHNLPKKNLPKTGPLSGGAVRLFEATDTLGVAEGVVTAIAAHELFGIPVWAALSTSGMKSFQPPPGLQRLVIFGDNDSHGAGQKAAFALAARLSGQIAEISVEIPPKVGTDWADVLNQRGAP